MVTFINKIYCSDFLLHLILNILSATLFVLIILLFILKVSIKNAILDFLGKISMEIYLIHGLLLLGLRSEIIYIKNELLFSLAVISGSILLSWILHKLFSILIKAVFAVCKL
jgi:peptidoglycan/LPS O-acetylase OafA/YrhL